MTTVTIQCDDCRAWETQTRYRAGVMEEIVGRLLCRACFGGDP